ncbi:hypothetical protein [Nocardia sp. CA-290969]|uniref:hypothetical protein n=1 Tax=Nocardia sp. CA-290969 TaxID=3239986 RepID=UPI003D8D65B8
MRTPDDHGAPDLSVGPLVRATDQDPWKKVAAQASKGRVIFHPAAAQSAALECAEVMGTVGALRQAIKDMGRLSELSHLPSGWYLANQLNGTTNTIDSVMDSFRTVLGEMLDTFKWAGRNYLASDDRSAAEFPGPSRQAMRAALAGIRPPTASAAPEKFSRQPPNEGREPATFSKGSNTEVTTVGARDVTDADDAGQKSGKPIEASELVRPANVNDNMLYFDDSNQARPKSLQQETLESGGATENPYSQQWRDLYDLGVSTQKAVKPVYHQAEMWKWVAGEMGKSVEGLAVRLTKVPEGEWDGAGAEAAKSAVQDYHARARDFILRIEAFSGNLDYASRWLKNTAKGMPDTPEPPESYYDPGQSYAHYDPYSGSGGLTGGGSSIRTATEADIARQLAIHRQNMENNYVVGVQNSSEYLPAFNELPAATAPARGDTPPPATLPAGSTTGPSGSGTSVPSGGAPIAPGRPMPNGVPDIPAGPAPLGPGARAGGPTGASAAPQTPTPTGALPPTGGSAAGSANPANPLADLAGKGLQSARSAAEEAAKQTSLPGGMPRVPTPPGMPPAGGPRPGGLSAGGAASGGTGTGGSSPAAPGLRSSPALFPRAALEGPLAGARAAAAGMGPTTPMNGAPGSPGAAGGNQGQQDKDHDRAKYLRSKKHLDQALGEGPTFTRSIVG